MSFKQKLNDVKNKTVDLYREHPVEMLMATAAVVTATAKAAGAINDSANAATWRREVKRRERMAKTRSN